MASPRSPDQPPIMDQSATGWHPEEIKAAIRKQYGSLSELARRWNVHRTLLSHALRQTSASAPTERLIAAAIGKAPHVLWPERWNAAGEPLPRAGLAKPAAGRRSQSTQKRGSP